MAVKDEDDLIEIFKFGWMGILILPSNEAIPSYFEETNVCMQMIDMIENAEPTGLTSYKSDEDFLTIAPNYRNNILRDFMCQFQEG